MKIKSSFKDELRRSLMIYALAPCIILVVICMSGYIILTFFTVSKNNKRECESNALRVEQSLFAYQTEAMQVSKKADIELFQSDQNYRTRMISEAYSFINNQNIRGEFYVFDKERNLLYTTNTQSHMVNIIREEAKIHIDKIIKREDFYIYYYESREADGGLMAKYMLFKPVYNNSVLEGILGYTIPVKEFEKIFLHYSGQVLVVNKFHRIIYGDKKNFGNERGKLVKGFRKYRGIVFLNQRWYYVGFADIMQNDMYIYLCSDCTLYIRLGIFLIFTVFLTALLMWLLIGLNARIFADKKTRIIYQLRDAFGEVEEGRLDVFLDIQASDEFKVIGSSFNIMIGSIRHLIERHQELARANSEAAIQIMQSEFNPHFLFNTLESVKYMIRFDPSMAEKMLLHLSRLLRYSIKSNQEMVCLGEELDFTDRYMYVMQMRYGDKLGYMVDIDCKSREVKVPRMILQPIIENSIKYGFDEEKQSIVIKISAFREQAYFIIQIEDNGRGIQKEFLFRLHKNLKENYNKTEHIGLYNVHRRIYLIYGKEYGLDINSEEGKGSCVRIKFPADKR